MANDKETRNIDSSMSDLNLHDELPDLDDLDSMILPMTSTLVPTKSTSVTSLCSRVFLSISPLRLHARH
ncbi:hypothetical protein OH492_12810 [Vibrio chagasii]|nr:hypothetical protein [Vibrio chagasii]